MSSQVFEDYCLLKMFFKREKIESRFLSGEQNCIILFVMSYLQNMVMCCLSLYCHERGLVVSLCRPLVLKQVYLSVFGLFYSIHYEALGSFDKAEKTS